MLTTLHKSKIDIGISRYKKIDKTIGEKYLKPTYVISNNVKYRY